MNKAAADALNAQRRDAVLAAVTRRPGLTAFEVARVLGMVCNGVTGRIPNSNAARKVLVQLETAGLLAHQDEPAGNMSGYRRLWFPAPARRPLDRIGLVHAE